MNHEYLESRSKSTLRALIKPLGNLSVTCALLSKVAVVVLMLEANKSLTGRAP